MDTQNKETQPESQRKPLVMSWRWALVALILVVIVSTSAVVLREHLKDFAQFGYLGAFLISLLASATVIAGIPNSFFIFALGGVLNPWYVGLAAGAGEAIGEFVIYMAGRTGHAFFLKDRFLEAQSKQAVHGIYPRLQRWIHDKGSLALFLSSAIFNPFFSLIGATAGATRFPAWKFFGAVWAGKTVKWTLVAIVGKAILDYILIRWFNVGS